MRILVTGATGYIGRAVSLVLAADGHDVVPMVRDTSAARATSLERSGLRPVQGDLGDGERVESLVREVDAVVHTALADDDPAGGDGAVVSALVAARADGLHRHLVTTSGCSIYGPGEHTVITESTPVDPETRRARSEDELAATGLPATVLRPAMVHGGDARGSIVGRWFAAARDGGPVHLGSPGKLWSWVHVDDVADAFAAVLREPVAHAGQTYLLADDQATPALTVLTAAARVAGCDEAVAFGPIEDELPGYRVFDRDEVVDATKARSRLGWIPSRPAVLDDLRASYAAWARA